jgi:hypothetical protein
MPDLQKGKGIAKRKDGRRKVADIEWDFIDDIISDREFRHAIIEALREIAEQLNRLNDAVIKIRDTKA